MPLQETPAVDSVRKADDPGGVEAYPKGTEFLGDNHYPVGRLNLENTLGRVFISKESQ
jgi:hypothetical protein